MKKLHVLILPSWFRTLENSQSGIFFYDQAKALSRYIKVGLIYFGSSSILYRIRKRILGIRKIIYKNFKNIFYVFDIPYIPKCHFLSKFYNRVLWKREVEKYIKKNGIPDIVHLHSFFLGDIALWMKKKFNVIYVVTEHATDFSRNTLSDQQIKFAKYIYKYSCKNIAVSMEFKNLLEDITECNFEYVPNLVDTSFFNINHIKKDKYIFINIGFLTKKKNQKLLIESFAVFHKKYLNSELRIIGDGPEFNELAQLILNLKLEKSIKLLGRLHRNKIKTQLSMADCFILSSDIETFGVVLLEAMSCGLPVISTKSGGPESIIKDKKLGLLCDKNVESMYKSMLSVYNTEYNSNYIREYILKEFSEEAVCIKLLRIYDEVLVNMSSDQKLII